MNPMPNAFLTINLSAPSPAGKSAAESSPSRPLGDVAAGPIETAGHLQPRGGPAQTDATQPAGPPNKSPMTNGGHQRAPAVAVPSAAAAGLLDSQIDWDALYDAIVPPEPPMFLRAPSRGYLDGLFELGRA